MTTYPNTLKAQPVGQKSQMKKDTLFSTHSHKAIYLSSMKQTQDSGTLFAKIREPGIGLPHNPFHPLST